MNNVLKTSFLLTLLFFGCTERNSFVYSEKTKPYIHGKIIWYDNLKQIFLRTEVENGFFMSEYKIHLSLNRVLNRDTVSYYLLDNAGRFRINNDYLYIYDNNYIELYSKDFYRGWIEKRGGKITILNESRATGNEKSDDKLSDYGLKQGLDSNYNVNLSEGLYRLTKKSLDRISDNPDDVMKEGDGVFFITEPGCGVKYTFNLRVLAEKLKTVELNGKNIPQIKEL